LSAEAGLLIAMVIFRKHVAGLSEAALARFVSRACRALNLRGLVNVLVTGSPELRTLNWRFRATDKPTDVLSFLPDPGFECGLAGDIAVSAEIAKQNARRLGHSAAQEIKVLVLHGVLHLAGYDHEHDHGRMAAREMNLRQSLGLPLGLIERNGRLGKGTLNRRAGRRNRLGKAAGKSARSTQRRAPARTRTR
jgi:probable rRNA maturation factor